MAGERAGGCVDPRSRTRGEDAMPLFMDVHNGMKDITAARLAAAHQRDLAVQDKYGVRFLKYWYDEATGKIFCLSSAPSREAAMAVHREAHGEEADEIYEVVEAE